MSSRRCKRDNIIILKLSTMLIRGRRVSYIINLFIRYDDDGQNYTHYPNKQK